MPKQLSVRVILEMRGDTGQIAQKVLDKTLSLSGFTDFSVRSIQLGAAADDYALTFTNAVFLAIYSSNYPFSARLDTGETLIENARELILTADDTADGLIAGPILLTGNGTYPCDLECWIVEKP